MGNMNGFAEERPLIFKNQRGQRLFGVLHLPAGENCRPVVLMAHGFTDDKTGDNRLFVKFARQACKSGLAVLRFDFAGSGDSEGDFSHMTIDTEIEDLHSAIDFIYSLPEIDKNRINLLGYSLGGAVSIMVAAKDLRVKSFIGWAPVSNLPGTFNRILGSKTFASAHQYNLIPCTNGDKKFLLKKAFFEKIVSYNIIEAVGEISPRQVLLLQGSRDKKIKPKETKTLFQNAKDPKMLHLIQGAEHSFAGFEDQAIDITMEYLLKWNLHREKKGVYESNYSSIRRVG